MMTEQEICQFVLDAGSDHLPTFGGTSEGGRYVQQVADEYAAMAVRVLAGGRGVNSYLEIGSAAGGSAYLAHHVFRPAKIVLVDDNRHWHHDKRAAVLAGIDRVEIIGLSGSREVVAQAAEYSPYDLIMVDGGHTYEDVAADAQNYIPMVAHGGFIAFHDSVVFEFGVPRLVEELKEDGRLIFIEEFISSTDKRLGLALFQRAA